MQSHSATNLLSQSNNKSWKCKTTKEPSASIVLNLDKAVSLNGIDIGNEHSAFIEVLVGKAGANADCDFQTILLTSSFMSPHESKSSTNPNRVRLFARNALIEEVAREKWNRIKIICTQPFNRHVQYGLAFIKLHAVAESESNTNKTITLSVQDTGSSTASPFAKFKMRKESTDSDSEASSNLFMRWKQSRLAQINGTPKSSKFTFICS